MKKVSSRPESAVERPVRWLAGFVGVVAGPGEAVTAEITLPDRVLAYWDAGWVVDKAKRKLEVPVKDEAQGKKGK